MKPEFHPVHGAPSETFGHDEIRDRFRNEYEQYRLARDAVQGTELESGGSDPTEFQKVLESKERLAEIVTDLYLHSNDLETFESELRETLANGVTDGTNIDEVIAAASIRPLSTLEPRYRSPVESIWSTLENLKTAQRFAASAQETTTSISMSGTNAWGPFYAVRGRVPELLTNIGVEQRDFDQTSDVDLIASAADNEHMAATVERLARDGFLDPRELERFGTFQELQKQNRADIFSARSHTQNVELSLHLLTEENMRHIAAGTEPNRKQDIGFMRDFRPNIPGNVRKFGSYAVYELQGHGKKDFQVDLEKIDVDGQERGYLSQLPSGGPVTQRGRREYYLGLLNFFMLVAPARLHDQGGFFWQQHLRLRDRVAANIDQTPAYIIRQEQMTRSVEREMKYFLNHADIKKTA